MREHNGIVYLSILEAANFLGYSTVRVRQLIHNRTLLGAIRGEQRSLWIPQEAVVNFARLVPTRKSMKPFIPKED